jgi:hypothetical protein
MRNKSTLPTAIVISALSLMFAGCATKPVVSGDSSVELKDVIYPKTGTQSTVKPGSIVHIRANYSSSFTHNLTQPLSMGVMLGNIAVDVTEPLVQANLSGENMYCTTSKTYRDPLTGPHAISCFLEGQKGTCTQIKTAPGSIWFTRDLPAPIQFVSKEVPVANGGRPFKRELVFDGARDGALFFSEKFYETTLVTANRIKPLISKVERRPMQITLDGAVLTVLDFTDDSLTYKLDKPWD